MALIALQSGEMSKPWAFTAGYLFSSLGAFGVVSLMSSPYRGPDADSLFSYRPVLAPSDPVGCDDGDDALPAGIPMTLGFIGKFYAGRRCACASVVAGCRGGCRLGDRSLLLPARGSEPVPERRSS